MLPFNNPVTEIIRQRYSCRGYSKTPIAPEQAWQLEAFAESITNGPLGTSLRFELVAATEHDRNALRGLGTYGLIKDPVGFIIGAAGEGGKNLEDFGYGMEAIILCATSIGLGTCWLGGNFTKSSFSKKIRATREEIVPAVASIGYAAENSRARDRLRQMARSDTRLPWEALFFRSSSRSTLRSTRSESAAPLDEASAGAYARRWRCCAWRHRRGNTPTLAGHSGWRLLPLLPSAHPGLWARQPGVHPVRHGRLATYGHRDRHVPLRADSQGDRT